MTTEAATTTAAAALSMDLLHLTVVITMVMVVVPRVTCVHFVVRSVGGPRCWDPAFVASNRAQTEEMDMARSVALSAVDQVYDVPAHITGNDNRDCSSLLMQLHYWRTVSDY